MSRDVMHITSNDGWQAVYIEGELVDQGHNIDWLYVISSLGCNTYNQEVDEDWLAEYVVLPTDLQDVVFK